MLSICIPTHNRFAFLKWAIERVRKDFSGIEYELIVSDNASTDDTRTVQVDKPIRYIRQPTNIGAFPNMREALLAATHKYCVFLGDDDYLLPTRVSEGIQFLEEHPGVNLYYAPCQLYDEVNHQVNWDAFYVSEEKTYHDASQLWNFVIHSHVWPEHAIYRRDGLEEILKPRERAYWAFLDLGNAFAKGPIHFASQPYYRNITNHPMGNRTKLGDRQCLTDFDEYRGGLECLAHDLFKASLSPELKTTLNTMIHHFICERLKVAHRIMSTQGMTEEARTYEKRLAICA